MKNWPPYYHIPEKNRVCDVPNCKNTAVLACFDEFCEVFWCSQHDDTGDSIFIWLDSGGIA